MISKEERAARAAYMRKYRRETPARLAHREQRRGQELMRGKLIELFTNVGEHQLSGFTAVEICKNAKA